MLLHKIPKYQTLTPLFVFIVVLTLIGIRPFDLGFAFVPLYTISETLSSDRRNISALLPG